MTRRATDGGWWLHLASFRHRGVYAIATVRAAGDRPPRPTSNRRIAAMIRATQELLQPLGEAISDIYPPSAVRPAFESPKQAAHCDLACTAAMQLARPLKRNPRELAQALIAALRTRPATQRWVEAIEIAGPGFINLRLTAAARQAVVAEVLAAGECFGHQAASGRRVMVEFVSANPTGPLHVGHGRNAALGDCICNLLRSQGH